MSNLKHETAMAIRDVNNAFADADKDVTAPYKTPPAIIQQAQAIAVGTIVAKEHEKSLAK